MSTDTPKPKKIVITPEEVAMTPTRKITGKFLSEALIFASSNPQYDNILFIELQDQ